MSLVYGLRYAIEFDRDLDAIRAYDAPIIRQAILQLSYQAEMPSRNRKRILKAVSWCPSATWQLRVGAYRVLFEVERGVVTLLRVTFKGTKTTEEMGQ